MGKRQTFFAFVGLIAASLLLCIYTFSALAHPAAAQERTATLIWSNFLFNLPGACLIGWLDYAIVARLGRRWPAHDLRRVLTEVGLASLMVALLSVLASYAAAQVGSRSVAVTASLLPVVLWNSLIVLFIELHFSLRRREQIRRRLLTIERERALYQYEALKAQINPHFLFNALGALASLVYEDADRANRFTKKLASVYRYLLTTRERQSVAVGEELTFVGAYLYLESIRFGEALRVETVETGGGETAGRQLFPASVQLLVENALKHNVATLARPLQLKICVEPAGVTVTNNRQPRLDSKGGGVGLAHLRERYRLCGLQLIERVTEDAWSVTLPYVPAEGLR